MIIIGISGKKGSGKDECFKAIKSYYESTGRTVARIAFADALKEEVARALLKPVSYIEQHKENFRLILQGWGTDYRRKLNGDSYWIHEWAGRINHSKVDVIVAPDTRFLNEFDLIHKYGGVVWRVFGRSDTKSFSDSHASETELDSFEKFDSLIQNNSSITQLKIEIDLQLQMHKYTK